MDIQWSFQINILIFIVLITMFCLQLFQWCMLKQNLLDIYGNSCCWVCALSFSYKFNPLISFWESTVRWLTNTKAPWEKDFSQSKIFRKNITICVCVCIYIYIYIYICVYIYIYIYYYIYIYIVFFIIIIIIIIIMIIINQHCKHFEHMISKKDDIE